MNEEQKKMRPAKTGQLLPGIFALNNEFVSFFLMKGVSGYVAIDSGADNDQTESALAELGITKDSVKAVLLTHDHGDHTEGLELFEGAKVYAVNTAAAGKNPSQKIASGESLDVDGLKVEVIASVGHKADSVCFLISGQYLFVGDNMSIKDGKADLFNSVYNRSDEQQQKDIQELAKVPGVTHVFTSHYGFADRSVFG